MQDEVLELACEGQGTEARERFSPVSCSHVKRNLGLHCINPLNRLPQESSSLVRGERPGLQAKREKRSERER